MHENAIETTLDAIFQTLENKPVGTLYLFPDGLYKKEELTRAGIKSILNRAPDFDDPEKWLTIWKRYFKYNFCLFHIDRFVKIHFKWN